MHGDFENAGHLLGVRDEFAVVGTLREEVLGVSLLKIVAADLETGDLRGNGEDRDAAAVAIVKAIDEMEISGTTAAGANGKFSGEVGVRAGGESGSFFVAHVDPFDLLLFSKGVGDAVERISGETVEPLDTGLRESFDQ